MASSGGKLIFKNTIIIYARMIITTLIGIFTSRYALQALGVSDFGLYNVVGGIITFLNIFSVAMTTTTQRYVNIEMGKEVGNPNKIYNICMIIHIAFAVGIFLIIEPLGLIYIHKFLNITNGNISDAVFVFQVSLISVALGIVNIPCQALMTSFEKFAQIALIDIVHSVLKLGFILAVVLHVDQALRWYAIGMAFITFVSFVFYHLACHIQWPDVIKWKLYRDKAIYKEILIFNNYTVLGATAYISRTQGATMIVNYFFDTIVNGAMAIAYQVENYVMMFVNNISRAVYPQVTKSFGAGNMDKSLSLTHVMIRVSVFLTALIAIPLFIILPELLELWLGNVPDGSLLFCQWTLVSAVTRSLSSGLTSFIQATGKIKWFQIIGGVLELSCLPVGALLFVMGAPAESIIIVFSVTTVLNVICSVVLLKLVVGLEIKDFWVISYGKILAVLTSMALVTILFATLAQNIGLKLVLYICLLLISVLSIYCLGFTKNEKSVILQTIHNIKKK